MARISGAKAVGATYGKVEAHERVVGADEGEVEDDDEREERAADVAVERLRILDADVDQRGDDHGEYEQHATEEREPLAPFAVGVAAQVLPVGDEHFVLFGGDAFAGFDDRLTADHADGNRLDRVRRGGVAGGRGGTVELDVGAQAETEDAEECLGGRP